MKSSSKPISSPSRIDKFPPPLMRFLRTNAASRSRGRSRSSTPIFVRKKNAAVQEPSSPEVTCMGKVRVTRSNQPARTNPSPNYRRRRYKRLTNTLFCPCLVWKRPVWRNRARFWGAGCGEKTGVCEDSLRSEPPDVAGDTKQRRFEEARKGEEGDVGLPRVSTESSSSPPKNALLLTRCRSAPYRNRDSGSPTVKELEEAAIVSRFCKESEAPIECAKSPKFSRISADWGAMEGPLILKRCRSAPSRRFKEVGAL